MTGQHLLTGRLLLFCGIPGSGKTTIASIVAARLPHCVHVQTDTIRATISHPSYTSQESGFVYAAATSTAAEALKRGYYAILDGTFPRQEFRNEALRRLSSVSVAQVVVFVWCTLDTALRRNSERSGPVPDETIVRIYRTFEAPTQAILIDSNEVGPGEAAVKVFEAISTRGPGRGG